MNQRISFCILSATGSPVRRVSVSRTMLRVVVVGLLVGSAVLGYLLFDYSRLRIGTPGAQQLTATIAEQKNEISEQQTQIHHFADQLNALKGRLQELSNFERKVRTLANLGSSNTKQDGLFGVGGTLPEDLDTRLSAKQDSKALLRKMHVTTEQLAEASGNQEQSLTNLLQNLETQVNRLAATPAIMPTEGWLTSLFGYRTSPFTGKREMHTGLDIAAEKGTPILASADGVITSCNTDGALGLTAVIDHGHGLVTRYGHTEKILVKAGERVKRGQEIAQIGSTGRSTGPHVHYEVLLNGMPVNPKEYILD